MYVHWTCVFISNIMAELMCVYMYCTNMYIYINAMY